MIKVMEETIVYPAKKQKDSRVVVSDVDADAAVGMVSVRNKKGVCVFRPYFLFDLNVEYKPSLGEDCKLGIDVSNLEIDEMEMESRGVQEELRMNGGYGFNDKIAK